MAARFRRVIALDVSAGSTAGTPHIDQLELVITDGIEIPVEQESIDLAFSNQVLEHLHVDDSLEHLRNVRSCLKPGACYVSLTPNRLLGPHDISRYFDETATGFHMREYTTRDLNALFREAGFSLVWSIIGPQGRFVRTATWPVTALEALLEPLPARPRRRLAAAKPIRWALSGRVVATK